jgi:hypothetical protein
VLPLPAGVIAARQRLAHRPRRAQGNGFHARSVASSDGAAPAANPARTVASVTGAKTGGNPAELGFQCLRGRPNFCVSETRESWVSLVYRPSSG